MEGEGTENGGNGYESKGETVYYAKAERELLTPLPLEMENIYLLPKGSRASLCMRYRCSRTNEILGYSPGLSLFIQEDTFVVPIQEDFDKQKGTKKEKRFCFVLSCDDIEPHKGYLHKNNRKGSLNEETPYFYSNPKDFKKFTKKTEAGLPVKAKRYFEILKKNWGYRQGEIDFDS